MSVHYLALRPSQHITTLTNNRSTNDESKNGSVACESMVGAYSLIDKANFDKFVTLHRSILTWGFRYVGDQLMEGIVAQRGAEASTEIIEEKEVVREAESGGGQISTQPGDQ